MTRHYTSESLDNCLPQVGAKFTGGSLYGPVVSRRPEHWRMRAGDVHDLCLFDGKCDGSPEHPIARRQLAPVRACAETVGCLGARTRRTKCFAVIDTGPDWYHRSIAREQLWHDAKDDAIGWDFFDNDNRPWDYDGHGTMVSGIIAADWNDKAGMAG